MVEHADAGRLVVVGDAQYGGRFASAAGPLRMVLPGEVVALPVAEVPDVEQASPWRVKPGCVHFGNCGGCHYQHAGYAQQVRLKEGILRGLLGDAGLGALPAIVSHSAMPWGYRNRVRMRIEAVGAGFAAGYSRAGSNEFLPVGMCPIAAPLLWRAMEALLAQAGEAGGGRWLAATAEVEMFCLGDESRVTMTLLLRQADPAVHSEAGLAGLCAGMRGALPELAGAGAMLHPELNRRARRAWEGAAWGAAGLQYGVGKEKYWVGRGAFFQVNRLLVERLVELVCAGQTGGLAWDLYAGVGLFSAVLSRQFVRVTAVEGGDEAVAGLRTSSRGGKGASGFEAVQMETVEFLRGRVLEREQPELVVLDPPRAGLGVEGAELLVRVGAARVVYVSCDPVTLARDVAVLVRGGYGLRAVDLIDLFPQTYHLETVVHLERVGVV